MSGRERILVTGAGGQLGVDVVLEAARRGHDVTGLDRRALDITDAAAVSDAVTAFKPQAIVHSAAWTNVDGAEDDEAGATRVNGMGAEHVMRAAQHVGAYVIAVSTDYVFDGEDPAGYREDAPTNPVNAYGRSKLAMEQAVLLHANAAVARTAWLFGSTGSNFVKTIARLAGERDAIDVVTDQTGCPTYTGHLAQALLDCVSARTKGIVHLVGQPTATWFDLARFVVETSGAECVVKPTTSDRFVRPAKRPTCSILQVTRTDTPAVGDWHDGVRAMLRPIPTEA